MSIPFSGTFKRSNGLVSALGKQLKSINLKAVKRVNITFDPFGENVRPTRDFLAFLSHPKVAGTNPKCILKTDVVCNRAPPTIIFNLIPEIQDKENIKQIKINASNLTSLELLQLCNKYISKLAPIEEPVNELKTKSEKKALKSSKRK